MSEGDIQFLQYLCAALAIWGSGVVVGKLYPYKGLVKEIREGVVENIAGSSRGTWLATGHYLYEKGGKRAILVREGRLGGWPQEDYPTTISIPCLEDLTSHEIVNVRFLLPDDPQPPQRKSVGDYLYIERTGMHDCGR